MKMLIALCVSILFVPISRLAANDLDRYLESTTVAVAQVDLARVDLPATTKFVQANFPDIIDAQSINGIQLVASGLIQSLRSAGVTKVYATLSTLELTQGHVALIVPCSKPAAAREPLDAILALLPANLGYKVHLNSDSVIVATDPVWNRLSELPKAERRALSLAVDQVANNSVSIVVNVREELRNEVISVFPERLPTGWPIAFSPKAVMEDVATLQFAVQTPPNVRANLSANCSDGNAAIRVSALANQVAELTGLSSLKCTAIENQARVSSSGDELISLIGSLTKSTKMSAAERQQSNNLKQILVAIHNFHSVYDGFPPRMTVSEKGIPLLSWRVFLLPYIDEQALYNEFHLDEPWDSPTNLKLVDRIPACYQSTQFPELKLGQTLVQAPLQTGFTWNGSENRMLMFKDITDGTSNTICFVVAPRDKGVLWTKPVDLKLGADSLVSNLFGDRESMEVAYFDSSIRGLDRTIKADSLKALMTHAGGEVTDR